MILAKRYQLQFWNLAPTRYSDHLRPDGKELGLIFFQHAITRAPRALTLEFRLRADAADLPLWWHLEGRVFASIIHMLKPGQKSQ